MQLLTDSPSLSVTPRISRSRMIQGSALVPAPLTNPLGLAASAARACSLVKASPGGAERSPRGLRSPLPVGGAGIFGWGTGWFQAGSAG